MEHSPETPLDPAASRALLRRQSLAAREALTPADHAARSVRIEAHLAALLSKRTPGLLAFCWPYRAEFDARPLVTRLLQQGWQACLPVVVAENAPMTFRRWTPDTPLVADRHGIMTPAAGPVVHPDNLLLPFNAIDTAGYRLGYGAGYFDRTLAALNPRPYVIGVGFALGVAPTVWPQPHDIAVNCYVTETETCRLL